jgi:hypothetical protein
MFASHLVGAGEHGCRHGKVQRSGRQEVDDEVKAALVEFPEQSSFPCPH